MDCRNGSVVDQLESQVYHNTTLSYDDPLSSSDGLSLCLHLHDLFFQGQKGVSTQRPSLTLELNGVPEETSVSGERLMIETDKDSFRVGRKLF